jgi:hypothetical protein
MSIVTQVFGSSKGSNPYTGSTPFTPANPYTGSSPFVPATSSTKGGSTPGVASWHVVVLWFLGSVALIALAEPAPQVATMIVVLLILGTLLNNWPVYKTYLGLPGAAGSATSITKG